MTRDAHMQHKQAILDYIQEYRGKIGISPTLRELSERIYGHDAGMGNISLLVNDLIEEGFLFKAAQGARTLMLVTPQPRPFYYKREAEATS